jgi:hypothetical protein
MPEILCVDIAKKSIVIAAKLQSLEMTQKME